MVRPLLVLTVLLSSALCTTPGCECNTTLALPVVETLAATDIGSASTTLNGRLTDMGDYRTVEVWFEYWPEDMSIYARIDKQTTKATGDFSAQASGLTTGITYYFRAYVKGTGQHPQCHGNALSFYVP